MFFFLIKPEVWRGVRWLTIGEATAEERKRREKKKNMIEMGNFEEIFPELSCTVCTEYGELNALSCSTP